jgi:lipopolysaccharide export system permease protein
LRNAGLNNWQIIKPVIIYSCAICCIHYIISFYFLPKSYRDFKDSKEYYKNHFATLLLEEGVFNTQSNNITVYINEKAGDNYFKGIFIHNMLDNLKPVTIIAESGYIIRTDAGPEFVLYNGTHQERNVKTGNVSMVTFHAYKFSMAKYEPSQMNRQLESNELYIHQLFDNFDTSDKNARFNIVNGNQRLIWPLYTIVLPLLAGAALLVGQFNRRFVWKKAAFAGSIGTLFIILSLVFNSLATRHIWMIAFMYGNILAALVIAGKLLCKDAAAAKVPFSRIPETFPK